MKGVADYLPLVRDVREIAATIARRVTPSGNRDAMLLLPGELRRTVEAVHPGRIPVRVVRITQETPTTKTFRLTPTSGVFPPFRAGQFVDVFLEVDGVQTSRPYSLSSAPGRVSSVDVTVRRTVRGFVGPHMLDKLQVGDVLAVSAPAGDLYHSPLTDTRELVFVAGGSGIAPFMSMIDDAIDRGLPLEMLLLYGSRSEDDIIFRPRLTRLARQHPEQLRVVLAVERAPEGWQGETGLMTPDLLLRHVPADSFARKTFYACGPAEMVRAIQAALGAAGVPPRRLHVEAFGPPADVTTEPDWPSDVEGDRVFEVTIEGRGTGVPARAREPLMNSLERAGLVLPALCRAGTCGTCRTRLVAGRVFTPRGSTPRQSDRIAGFIHPCHTYPVSDLTLRLL